MFGETTLRVYLCTYAFCNILMINQQKKAIYRIKAVLAEKQLSGKWLANEIGRTENTVSRWCSNKVQPFLENLLEIAKALKVDVRDLLRSTEE